MSEAVAFQQAQAPQNDPVSLIEEIDREIAANKQQDGKQSYLGQFTDFFYRKDEKTLGALEKMRDEVVDKWKKGETDSIAAMATDIRKKIEEDQKALGTQDKVNFGGGLFLKTAALFMPGPIGIGGAIALGSLDKARPGDSVGTQLADASLGGLTGGLTRGLLGVAGGLPGGFITKGIVVGAGSRVLGYGLDRHTYIDQKTGEVSFGQGLKDVAVATFNPASITMDVATFGVARGLFGGADRILNGAISQSPFWTTTLTGTTMGFTSGTTGEIYRQYKAGEPFSLAKAMQQGAFEAGITTIAAMPGGAMNSYIARLEARNRAELIEILKGQRSEFKGTLVKGENGVMEYRKPAPVQAEQVKTAFTETTARGSTLSGKAGDYRVTGADGSSWVVDKAIFESTHQAIAGKPGHFQKTATIIGFQLDQPVSLQTLEGPVTGEAGDWLVQGPAGEQWIITGPKFAETYAPVEPPKS